MVTTRQRRLPDERTRRVTWIAWAACGKHRPATAATLSADLDAAVAVIAGGVHDGDLPPRQPGELGVQTGLVDLDDQQVVGAAVDQEVGVVALGVHGVGRDDHLGEVHTGKQRLEGGDLVGRRAHLALGEHGAVVVVQRCQQVHLVA
jgi:hypothetical protein